MDVGGGRGLFSCITPSTAQIHVSMNSTVTLHRPKTEPLKVPRLSCNQKVHYRIHKSPALSPRHGASSGCYWRTRPPDMETNCEYIE